MSGMRRKEADVVFRFSVVCVLLMLSFMGAFVAEAAIPAAEREVLIALYDSTNGAGWTDRTNWRNAGDTDFNDPGTECTWSGVTCHAGGDTLTRIDFDGSGSGNNLVGSIPSELGDLANLERLDLSYNRLSGSIPSELGDLANLERLDLSYNRLSGSIPVELGGLANLEWLVLGPNRLSGSIPSELSDLANLQLLWLSGNQLSWSIPPELGFLANLERLNLSSNRLSGSIPPELGDLANLEKLELGYNLLSGSIPSELVDLANLESLSLYLNQLSGSIPPELVDLTNLESLNLSSNQLSGSIPPELGGLANLQSLYLSSNQLSGSIPPELGGLASLEWLVLVSNRLSGSIPSELVDLANLQSLWLSDNQLSGSIPSELVDLANLERLNLSSNRLSGSIPPELGDLANLEILELSSNRLSGSIPSELGRLANLTSLGLNSNQLSGSIPPELVDLANLESLDLSFNQLSGSIPLQLGGLANLRDLYLRDNQLSGSIPSELVDLANLQSLWLYSNRLSGSIPSELGSLANLTSLRLKSNQLSGSIPVELMNLSNLTDNTSLDYNALWTDDPALQAFLDSKDPDWTATQTVVPLNATVSSLGDHAAGVSWVDGNPDFAESGFEVFFRRLGTFNWTSAGWTSDADSFSFLVAGLEPVTDYEFALRSFTDPHEDNQNRVESDLSDVVVATTTNNGTTPLEIVVGIGNPVTLSVPATYVTYLWSTGETRPSITVSPDAGQWYWVYVTTAEGYSAGASVFLGGAGPECEPIWVAAAASSDGIGGARWATDLGITNSGSEMLQYAFKALPRGEDNSAVEPGAFISLGVDESVVYTDVWNEVTGGAGAGALEICIDKPAGAGVVTRTYNTGDQGTCGQTLEGVAGSDPAVVNTGETATLGALFGNADFRTNLGFVNATAEEITIEIVFFDSVGTNLGRESITLPPLGNDQWSRAYPRVFAGDVNAGYVQVSSATPGAAFLTYASVIDGRTGDPTTIWPFADSMAGDQGPCIPVWVAAAASIAGTDDTSWATDLTVTNLGSTALEYSFQLLTRDEDNSNATQGDPFNLAAGASVAYADIWQEMALGEGAGAINVCVAPGSRAGVSSRTYNTGAEGTFGQSIVGIPAGSAHLIGQYERVRLGFLFENDAYRTNLGFMNATDSPVNIWVEFYTAEGTSLGRRFLTLEPLSNSQWNQAYSKVTQDAVAGGFVEVWSPSEGAEFLTYASVVDETTGDPSTIWPF